MSDDRDLDPRDMLAAEYVLGTLDPAERDAATRLASSDPAFARAVALWERRLSPIADRVPAQAPSADSWRRIIAQISADRPTASGGNIVALQRSLARWRTATVLTGALAAALTAFVINRDLLMSPTPAADTYVAALNRGGDMPALIVKVDLSTKAVTVRPLDMEAPAGKSLELWYVGAGQAPKSMGVLKKDRERMVMPSGMETTGALFAVSLEPAGGSPTGAATGPIVYKGALIPE